MPADAHLPMDVQTALLRIAQGAVANVAQHADATTVDISLTVTETHATLTVHDDGVGFDPGAGRQAGRHIRLLGLRAMAERVDQLGGRLDIDSAPGDGATITATVELDRS